MASLSHADEGNIKCVVYFKPVSYFRSKLSRDTTKNLANIIGLFGAFVLVSPRDVRKLPEQHLNEYNVYEKLLITIGNCRMETCTFLEWKKER